MFALFNCGIIRNNQLKEDHQIGYYVGLKGCLKMRINYNHFYFMGGMTLVDAPHSVSVAKGQWCARVAVSYIHKNHCYNSLVFNAYFNSSQYDKTLGKLREYNDNTTLRNDKNSEIKMKKMKYGFVGVICNKKFPANLRKIVINNNKYTLIGKKDKNNYYGD